MSNYGFGSGPFSSDSGDLNSAIEAARKVMGGYKPDLLRRSHNSTLMMLHWTLLRTQKHFKKKMQLFKSTSLRFQSNSTKKSRLLRLLRLKELLWQGLEDEVI